MKKIGLILLIIVLSFTMFISCEKQHDEQTNAFVEEPKQEVIDQTEPKQEVIDQKQPEENETIVEQEQETPKEEEKQETIDVEAVLAVFQDVETVSYANGNIVDLVCESFDGILETDENEINLCYEYMTNTLGWNLIRYFAMDNYGNYYRLLQVDTGIIYDEAVDVLPCIHTYQATTEKIEIPDYVGEIW